MKPKKLTLREIHKLYLLLRHSIPEKEEPYLLNEIEKMVNMMEGEQVLIKAVEILFPKLKVNKDNPFELLLLFIRGLKYNDFFDYASFVKGIRGKRPSSI